MKALVIDDDEHIRVLTEWVFTRAGDGVSLAASGREGIAHATAAPPDVVLLDFYLDDMSGAEVLASLRSDPATRHVPVIFLTARDLEHGAAEPSLADVAGVITKPFDPGQLRDLVFAMIQAE